MKRVEKKESVDFIDKYFYVSYIIIIIGKYVCKCILYCVFFFFSKWEKEEEVN